MNTIFNPVSSEKLSPLFSSLVSESIEKKVEEKNSSSKAKMGAKLLPQAPAPKIISGAMKSADEALMQALALIQELEILLILLHNKDIANQGAIGKSIETHAINQQKLQEAQINQMHEIEHKMKKRVHIMKIIEYTLGAVALAASTLMGLGAFVVSAIMFSMQVSGAMQKITENMSPALKAAFFIGMVVAGAVAAGGIDEAAEGVMTSFSSAGQTAAEEGIEMNVLSVAAEAEQASTNVAEEQTTEEVAQTVTEKYNSFVKGGFITAGQTSSLLQQPISLLLQKIMGKKAADIMAEITVMLIALVSMIAAAKANNPELTVQSSAKSFLGTGAKQALFRASQGVTGGLMSAEGYLGFLQAAAQKKDAGVLKEKASTDALLTLLHEILQRVDTLVGFSTKVQGGLEKSFGNEMQAIATLPLLWEGAARVITNSAA